MNHKNGFNPLSRTASHRRAMSRNMVTSLFRYERITTTKAKALEVRKAAEKLITRSKVDSVHNRRQAARFIADEVILAKLFTDIGPRMKERNGGYTRILKLGFRQGDAADLVILELVDYKLDTSSKDKDAKKDEKGAKAAPKAKGTEKADTKAKTDAKPKAKAVKDSASSKAKAPAEKAVAKADKPKEAKPKAAKTDKPKAAKAGAKKAAGKAASGDASSESVEKKAD